MGEVYYIDQYRDDVANLLVMMRIQEPKFTFATEEQLLSFLHYSPWSDLGLEDATVPIEQKEMFTFLSAEKRKEPASKDYSVGKNTRDQTVKED